MPVKDSYLTVEAGTEREIKVQKSRFIAQAFPFKSQEDLNGILAEVKKKYYDASHHPFAYRLGIGGDNFRYSDDGEPSGSSGKPVLEAIDKFSLTDVVVIVTRYFGGTKLGVGGLRRAYFEAAETCLGEAEIREKFLLEMLELQFDYRFMNMVMQLISKKEAVIKSNDSGEKVKLACEVRSSRIAAFKKELVNLTSGTIIIK